MGKLRQLNDKRKRVANQYAFGSRTNTGENEPHPGDMIEKRDGGNAWCPDYHDGSKELQAIYREYVKVYDKVGTVRRRTRSYRKPATVLVNAARLPRL